MAMKRSFPLIGLTLLVFAVLIAASPGGASAADVIKFGVSTPLSGPAAPWGIPHKNATELIFDEINAQGGLRSEERRVGKECRSRWSTHSKKKKNSNGLRSDMKIRSLIFRLNIYIYYAS